MPVRTIVNVAAVSRALMRMAEASLERRAFGQYWTDQTISAIVRRDNSRCGYRSLYDPFLAKLRGNDRLEKCRDCP